MCADCKRSRRLRTGSNRSSKDPFLKGPVLTGVKYGIDCSGMGEHLAQSARKTREVQF